MVVVLVIELCFDFVIMDVKMFQLDGISVVEKLYKGNIVLVVLLMVFSQKEFVECVSEVGVLVYVVKLFMLNDFFFVIEIVLVCYEQIIMFEVEVVDMVECFEICKFVDWVKGLLNEKMGFSEFEVFCWIQKVFMDCCLMMQDVVKVIIEQFVFKKQSGVVV